MGIYVTKDTERHEKTINGGETWIEINEEPGVKRRRRVVAGPWEEERTDCYCCSCAEGGHDAACRNHGFAGERPCEEHNMPGTKWEHNDVMPDSVQEVRRKRERGEAVTN